MGPSLQVAEPCAPAFGACVKSREPASQRAQVGGEGLLAAAWDELAIGLEIGVQPRVEIRCVKHTSGRVKAVGPRRHRGGHTCVQERILKPSPPPLAHRLSPTRC